ncbi:helix-turn-helix transcriptional regulator [Streptosporangiaceae bacterium NEAU-GS5]|nr:helix-turn-helix transcriptional regulator [Streptosporangiaceae bacterium NEAU-GS5]
MATTLRTRLLPIGRRTAATLDRVIEGSCQTFVSDCNVRAAVELISHTWDPVVLTALRLGPTRRKDLLTRIAGVSDKALTEALRRVRAHGLVVKGPRALYELSPLGESFANGPLVHLAQWAADNADRMP